MAEKKKRTPWLQRRNWFVSAGLVIVLYLVVLFILDQFPGDTSSLKMMCHALPLIAVLMVVVGIFEKKKEEDEERIRARKRYEARMEMSRVKRQADALATQKQAPQKSGGSENESR